MKKKYYILILSIAILFGCQKEDINNDNSSAALHFSADTITFDTIFTSIGSITKTLTVYNRNSFEVNTDNTDLGITMRDDEFAIEIDEDITHSRLVQDVHMGR